MPSEQVRLKLTISYDGSKFHGWQSQRCGETIQNYLELAFQKLGFGNPLSIQGAGRTDSGVHAIAQTAHTDVSRKYWNRFSLATAATALNAHLPNEIRVLDIKPVSTKFHARFSAKGKQYQYRIWNGKVINALEIGRCWHLPAKIDFEILSKALRTYEGTHDFKAFSANRGKLNEPNSTIRTIKKIKLKKTKRLGGTLIVIDFEGDGFLYKMVRILVAAAIACSSDKPKIRLEELKEHLLTKRSRQTDRIKRFLAPAEGLYLNKVLYK